MKLSKSEIVQLLYGVLFIVVIGALIWASYRDGYQKGFLEATDYCLDALNHPDKREKPLKAMRVKIEKFK